VIGIDDDLRPPNFRLLFSVHDVVLVNVLLVGPLSRLLSTLLLVRIAAHGSHELGRGLLLLGLSRRPADFVILDVLLLLGVLNLVHLLLGVFVLRGLLLLLGSLRAVVPLVLSGLAHELRWIRHWVLPIRPLLVHMIVLLESSAVVIDYSLSVWVAEDTAGRPQVTRVTTVALRTVGLLIGSLIKGGVG